MISSKESTESRCMVSSSLDKQQQPRFLSSANYLELHVCAQNLENCLKLHFSSRKSCKERSYVTICSKKHKQKIKRPWLYFKEVASYIDGIHPIDLILLKVQPFARCRFFLISVELWTHLVSSIDINFFNLVKNIYTTYQRLVLLLLT